MNVFLRKWEKMVHIVLYGPAISQPDSIKAGTNQLPLNKDHFRNSL